MANLEQMITFRGFYPCKINCKHQLPEMTQSKNPTVAEVYAMRYSAVKLLKENEFIDENANFEDVDSCAFMSGWNLNLNNGEGYDLDDTYNLDHLYINENGNIMLGVLNKVEETFEDLMLI